MAVHPILEAIGFLDHVREHRQARTNGPLFELTANTRGHTGAGPSRFWRDYLKRIGVKSGRDGIGSHSFRHAMADQLRAADFLDHEIGPLIFGHSNASNAVTAGYGVLTQGTAKRLRDMIASVRFEGVNFDHLMPARAEASADEVG